jgi:anaerobic ribonucleoside-triphosphate reductase activating protein
MSIGVYKILTSTRVEGPGIRFCIWTQGCKKHCPGCWAKETWSFDNGTSYNIETLYKMIVSEKNIEGVTFLGGEPFEQAEELSHLAKLIKTNNLSIVCFTGYTLEELKSKNDGAVNEFLKYIDLLIDGGFEQDKFDLSRPWVGSSNQRYIFLTDFYSFKDIEKYSNKVEAHLLPDGKLELNGMGNFEKIKKQLRL